MEVVRKDGIILLREMAAEVKNFMDFKMNAVMVSRDANPNCHYKIGPLTCDCSFCEENQIYCQCVGGFSKNVVFTVHPMQKFQLQFY